MYSQLARRSRLFWKIALKNSRMAAIARQIRVFGPAGLPQDQKVITNTVEHVEMRVDLRHNALGRHVSVARRIRFKEGGCEDAGNAGRTSGGLDSKRPKAAVIGSDIDVC